MNLGLITQTVSFLGHMRVTHISEKTALVVRGDNFLLTPSFDISHSPLVSRGVVAIGRGRFVV